MPTLIALSWASRCDLSQWSCSFRSWIANEPLSSREIFPTYCRHEKKICWLKIQDMISSHSAHCVICTFVFFCVPLKQKSQPPFPLFSVARVAFPGWCHPKFMWMPSAETAHNWILSQSATRTQFLRFFWCDENSNLRSLKPQTKATERICRGNLSFALI